MIFGLRPRINIPENSTPLEAVAIVKYIDDEGSLGLSMITTTGLSAWEALGMVVAAEATMKDDMVQSFLEGDGEDDDE